MLKNVTGFLGKTHYHSRQGAFKLAHKDNPELFLSDTVIH